MTYDDQRKQIHILIKTSALKMGFGEPSNIFCDGVFEDCIRYGLPAIEEALNSFRKEDIKCFPKLGQLISRLKFLKKLSDEKKTIPDKNLFCSYKDEKESQYSRDQCKKILSPHDMEVSVQRYGKVYCYHHRRRIDCINHPDSRDSISFREEMIEGERFRRKGVEMGITMDKFPDVMEYIDAYWRFVREMPEMADMMPYAIRNLSKSAFSEP